MLELAFGDHPYKVYFGEEDGSFMAMLEYIPLLLLKCFVPGHFKLCIRAF